MSVTPLDQLDFKQVSQDIFQTLNQARGDPQSYLPIAEQRLKYLDGTTLHVPGEEQIYTLDGSLAVKNLIRWLKEHGKPVPPVKYNTELEKVAEQIVKKVQQDSEYNKADVPEMITKHGFHYKVHSCVTDFDWRTGEHFITGILVDDGVAAADRRKAIMKEDLALVGIAGGIAHVKRGFKVDIKTVFAIAYVEGAGTAPAGSTREDEPVTVVEQGADAQGAEDQACANPREESKGPDVSKQNVTSNQQTKSQVKEEPKSTVTQSTPSNDTPKPKHSKKSSCGCFSFLGSSNKVTPKN